MFLLRKNPELRYNDCAITTNLEYAEINVR